MDALCRTKIPMVVPIVAASMFEIVHNMKKWTRPFHRKAPSVSGFLKVTMAAIGNRATTELIMKAEKSNFHCFFNTSRSKKTNVSYCLEITHAAEIKRNKLEQM